MKKISSRYDYYNLGYGIVLLDKIKDKYSEPKNSFNTVFFQGDDAVIFQEEMDKLIKAKLNNKMIENCLSDYLENGKMMTMEELNQINIYFSPYQKINTAKKLVK